MSLFTKDGELNDAMFSSEKQDHETPDDFFNKLNDEFKFTIDAAATAENAKCPKFYTPEQDALSFQWGAPGETVFCNPPYKNVADWMKQGYESSVANSCIVVMLVPSRTDTKWFRDFASRAIVRFVVGRLKFKGTESSAPFPSMLVIFNPAIERALGLGPDNMVCSAYDWKA